MGSPNLYASLAEFKDRLGIAGDDQSKDYSLDHVLQSASRWIDTTLGRRFYTTAVPETRYFTACESYWYLYTGDLLSLTELATDANGDGTYETIWLQGTDFRLGPRNASAFGEPYNCIEKIWWTGRFSLPSYPDAVRITGQFGYCSLANVPPQIRELTMMVAETDSGPVNDLTIPGVSTYKLGSELTVTSGSRQLSNRAHEIINLYKVTKAGAFVT